MSVIKICVSKCHLAEGKCATVIRACEASTWHVMKENLSKGCLLCSLLCKHSIWSIPCLHILSCITIFTLIFFHRLYHFLSSFTLLIPIHSLSTHFLTCFPSHFSPFSSLHFPFFIVLPLLDLSFPLSPSPNLAYLPSACNFTQCICQRLCCNGS